MRVIFSVFSPVAGGMTKMEVFSIDAAQPLEWFKKHSDELAQRCAPGVAYNALNIEALPQVDSASALH